MSSNFLISVDPSLTCTGWALWDLSTKRLMDVGYTGTKSGQPTGERIRIAGSFPVLQRKQVTELVIEWPQIYGGRSKGDPNDLLLLAAVTGVVINTYLDAEVTLLKPREWKGQTPKDIQNTRDFAKLTAQEQALVNDKQISKTKLNNVLDAVGIGLHYLSR